MSIQIILILCVIYFAKIDDPSFDMTCVNKIELSFAVPFQGACTSDNLTNHSLRPKNECSNERPGYSDYIYHENVHGWTKLHPEPVDWVTAKANCLNEGATLFYPWTKEFRAAGFRTVIAKLNSTGATEIMPVYAAARVRWLGPPETYKQNGKWKMRREWLLYCVVYNSNITIGRVPCDQKHGYICFASKYSCGGTHNSDNEILPGDIVIPEGYALEDRNFYGESISFEDDNFHLNNTITPIETLSNETNSSMRTVYPQDYALDPRTGHCYKLYNEGKTWNKSRGVCQNDGGDLVVINSLEEANFVKKIYAKYNFFINTHHSFEMFVGIYEKDIYSWSTINGENLHKAGYAVWAEGKPGGKPYDWPEYMKSVRRTCGSIDKQGRYNDCWCEVAHGHICEKLATDIAS